MEGNTSTSFHREKHLLKTQSEGELLRYLPQSKRRVPPWGCMVSDMVVNVLNNAPALPRNGRVDAMCPW